MNAKWMMIAYVVLAGFCIIGVLWGCFNLFMSVDDMAEARFAMLHLDTPPAPPVPAWRKPRWFFMWMGVGFATFAVLVLVAGCKGPERWHTENER